jgi:hypothetical protein
MTQLTRLCVTGLLAIILSGCAGPKLYYWGDYSETLYANRKTPGDETQLTHIRELEEIIKVSNQRNQRVPPGVYAELGYFYLKTNKSQQAVAYFRQEQQLYPESTILMERLIKKVSASTSTKNGEKE